MGAYGSERTTQALQDFPVVDSEEEAEEVGREVARLACAPVGWGWSVCSFVRSASIWGSGVNLTLHQIQARGCCPPSAGDTVHA